MRGTEENGCHPLTLDLPKNRDDIPPRSDEIRVRKQVQRGKHALLASSGDLKVR